MKTVAEGKTLWNPSTNMNFSAIAVKNLKYWQIRVALLLPLLQQIIILQ